MPIGTRACPRSARAVTWNRVHFRICCRLARRIQQPTADRVLAPAIRNRDVAPYIPPGNSYRRCHVTVRRHAVTGEIHSTAFRQRNLDTIAAVLWNGDAERPGAVGASPLPAPRVLGDRGELHIRHRPARRIQQPAADRVLAPTIRNRDVAPYILPGDTYRRRRFAVRSHAVIGSMDTTILGQRDLDTITAILRNRESERAVVSSIQPH